MSSISAARRRGFSLVERRLLITITAGGLFFLFGSALLLYSLADTRAVHDTFSTGKVMLSELAHFQLRQPWFFASCSVSQPVFFLTTDGGINVAGELSRACPSNAFVVLRQASLEDGLAEDDTQLQHSGIEKLAIPAAQAPGAAHLRGLHVAYLAPAELEETATGSGESDYNALPTPPAVAYLRVELVVMRNTAVQMRRGAAAARLYRAPARTPPEHSVAMEADGAAAGADEQVTEELYATRQVLLRAPLVGRHRAHRHLRIGAISDSQSGAKVFRDLLGHMAEGHVLEAEQQPHKQPAGEPAAPKQKQGAARPAVRGKHGKGKGGSLSSWALSYLRSRAAGPQQPLDLLVHGGDTVQGYRDDREAFMYLLSPIADLYSAAGPTGMGDGLGYAVPLLLVRGNHDDVARHAAYVLPPARWGGASQGGVPQLPPRVDAGGAATPAATQGRSPLYSELWLGPGLRLLVTDTSDESEEQAAWLSRVCGLQPAASVPSSSPSRDTLQPASSPAVQADFLFGQVRPLTIAWSHVPPYVEFWDKQSWAAGEDHWTDYVRQRLLPVMQCCQPAVDLLVSGHSHLYQRGATPPMPSRAPCPPRSEAPGEALPDADGSAQVLRTAQPIVLATIGGGGGSLESHEEGRVFDAHAFSYTSWDHHYVMMDYSLQSAGSESGPGRSHDGSAPVTPMGRLEWAAVASHGTDGGVFDRISIQVVQGEA
jgi:hypothetical protein